MEYIMDRRQARGWTGKIVIRGLWLWWALCSLAGAATFELDPDPLPESFYLTPHIDRYSAADPPNDIRAAATLPDTDFSPVGKASPLRPLDTSWFRFSIHNPSSGSRSLVLDFDQALFSRVEWYARSATTERYVLTGQDLPFASRDLDYDFFAFRLDIPPGETLTVNFSIYTPYATLFVPKLVDAGQFVSQVTFYSRFTGAILGMLYAIFFFMAVYMLRVRTVGLVYAMCGFSLACMLSVLYISGAIQRMLPDTAYPWRDAAYVLIHGLQGVTLCGVLRGFYQSARYHWLLDKLLLAIAALEIVIALLLPWAEMRYLLLSTLCLNGLLMLVSLPLGVLALLQRRTETYLFSAGLLLFMLMALVSSLGAFGVLPISFMTRYGYELGLTMQVDFLFLAVVSQLLTIQREKTAYEAEMIQLNADIKARSEFVDKVTHDLKAPLTAVLGAEQLLRDEKDDGKRARFLDIINSSSRMVATMIDDMLGYSRMQQGKLSLQSEPLSLPLLLQEIHTSIDTLPRATGVTFHLQVDESIPPVLQGDRVRLSQLLTNLLTNAIKFTKQGSVTLKAEVVDITASQVWLRFSVADTGIGMAPAFIQQAFDPYVREESRVGGFAGFGLGLSICKQLVELMGGSITVTSEPDKGTCFSVLLPFSRE